MEISQACCSDPLNCPSTKLTPETCPVGCSLLFPAFLEDCGHSTDGLILEADLPEYEEFLQTCLAQDPADVLEYANDLIEEGCTIDVPTMTTADPPAHLPASNQLFEVDTWMRGIQGSTCLTVPALEQRLSEVQRICCVDGACEAGHRRLQDGMADTALPDVCTPECALLFHGTFS